MKKFEITKEQIEIIAGCSIASNDYVRALFPDAFKKEFEVGKWYKGNILQNSFVFITEEKNGYGNGYGFLNGDYRELMSYCEREYWQEATSQEVESALICEAKKRGFKEGIYFIEPINLISFDKKERLAKGNIEMYNSNSIRFSESSSLIYKNGVWATIIETITIQEAEKLLNKKIV